MGGYTKLILRSNKYGRVYKVILRSNKYGRVYKVNPEVQ